MFAPPKGSKYTLIQQKPATVHKVAYLTGGLTHLYKEIRNNNLPQPSEEGDFTDNEGVFAPEPGMPLMASRYKFLRLLGKGQSSVLVKVADMFQDGALRSVKVLHTHYSLLGVQESDCVRRINLADPFDTSGTLRLWNTFNFHGHYCMVFELLSPDPMTTYFKDLSLPQVIPAIRKVALRLLQSLGFLQQQNVIHADLKPSNILLKKDADLSSVKVVDFGNAIHCIHEEMSLYYDDFELQTLLYRAPEVIYGLTFGLEVDMWSLGCVLAELYLNRPLFCGSDKEETMENMTDFLGPLPHEVFKRGKFFNDLSQFTCRSAEVTPVTTHELMEKLGCTDYTFVDFIRLLLLYNPHERMTVPEAARHPFLAPEIGFGYIMSSGPGASYPSVLLDHENYTKRPFIDEQRKRQHLSSTDLLREGTSPCQSAVKVAYVLPVQKDERTSGDTHIDVTFNNNNNNNNNNNTNNNNGTVSCGSLQYLRLPLPRGQLNQGQPINDHLVKQPFDSLLSFRNIGLQPKVTTLQNNLHLHHPTAVPPWFEAKAERNTSKESSQNGNHNNYRASQQHGQEMDLTTRPQSTNHSKSKGPAMHRNQVESRRCIKQRASPLSNHEVMPELVYDARQSYHEALGDSAKSRNVNHVVCIDRVDPFKYTQTNSAFRMSAHKASNAHGSQNDKSYVHETFVVSNGVLNQESSVKQQPVKKLVKTDANPTESKFSMNSDLQTMRYLVKKMPNGKHQRATSAKGSLSEKVLGVSSKHNSSHLANTVITINHQSANIHLGSQTGSSSSASSIKSHNDILALPLSPGEDETNKVKPYRRGHSVLTEKEKAPNTRRKLPVQGDNNDYDSLDDDISECSWSSLSVLPSSKVTTHQNQRGKASLRMKLNVHELSTDEEKQEPITRLITPRKSKEEKPAKLPAKRKKAPRRPRSATKPSRKRTTSSSPESPGMEVNERKRRKSDIQMSLEAVTPKRQRAQLTVQHTEKKTPWNMKKYRSRTPTPKKSPFQYSEDEYDEVNLL